MKLRFWKRHREPLFVELEAYARQAYEIHEKQRDTMRAVIADQREEIQLHCRALEVIKEELRCERTITEEALRIAGTLPLESWREIALRNLYRARPDLKPLT